MKPGEVTPMEMRQCRAVPHGGYVYQVKWDGVRILAFATPDGVILQNRRLRMRTRQYPELQEITALFRGGRAVLDGEVVSPRVDGTTSFQALLRRDFASNAAAIGALSEQVPIRYVVFDILSLHGVSLLNLPLEQRLYKLRETLPQKGHIAIIEDFRDGDLLYEATRQACMEGIVAKKTDSPYVPGQKVSTWLKVKHRLRDTFVVIGYTIRTGRVNALIIGVKDTEGNIRPVGRVGSGLTEAQIDILSCELPKLRTDCSTAGIMGDSVAVHPVLLAEVEFMEWTEDLMVRAPSLKGFSFGGGSHE
jgi:bifunctional non-homologous end joining protein LigD